jgi:hypothetical protein
MKPYKAAVVLLAFVPMLASARKKSSQPKIPAVFNQAQYVYVRAMDGDEFNPYLLPEDRQAIADVETAIQKWGRYVLVYQRSQADLVFIVRTGRLATARGNVGVFHGPAPIPTQGPFGRGQVGQGPGQQGNRLPPQAGNGTLVGAGGEVGPANDLLWVCMPNTDGTLSSPLWSRTEQDGLESPNLPLLKKFEHDVDKAYPRTTASKKKP